MATCYTEICQFDDYRGLIKATACRIMCSMQGAEDANGISTYIYVALSGSVEMCQFVATMSIALSMISALLRRSALSARPQPCRSCRSTTNTLRIFRPPLLQPMAHQRHTHIPTPVSSRKLRGGGIRYAKEYPSNSGAYLLASDDS